MKKPRIYKRHDLWWCKGSGGCPWPSVTYCADTPVEAYLGWLALITGHNCAFGHYSGAPIDLLKVAERLFRQG